MPGSKGLIATAAAAAAVALSACGGSDPEPSIPLSDGETLVLTLREIEANVDEGSCIVAADKVDELRSEIEGLPSEVNEEVRTSLEEGADRLELLVGDECEEPEEPETTTEETETEPTTTEETEPTTTEETTPTEPTVPTTPTTPGGGGTGGLGPAGQGGGSP